MWWQFWKKESDIEELKKSIELSFSKVKADYEEHRSKTTEIITRLEALEKSIGIKDQEKSKIKEILTIAKNIELREIENLTDQQKAFCQILAALHSESPDEWISFKALAEDLYPSTDYNKIRSTISEYTSLLEELGFVKKRMKGNKAYVKTTEKNPFLKAKQQKQEEVKEEQPKKQDKKSKQ